MPAPADVRPGVICIQGGVELTPRCEPMDREVLDRSGSTVAVLAGAARPGTDYAGASSRAAEHYERLGADVVIVPDPRESSSEALRVLGSHADLVVLPGGSPTGLLDVLAGVDGGIIGNRLIEMWSSGVGLSGASAGAMVLCRRTATPGGVDELADGLGLLPGLAVPHWAPGSERRWQLPDALLWGLPECGGVLVAGDRMRAVGEGAASVRIDGSWREVSRDDDVRPTGGRV